MKDGDSKMARVAVGLIVFACLMFASAWVTWNGEFPVEPQWGSK